MINSEENLDSEMLLRRCLRDFPECFPTPSKQKLSSGMQRRRAQQRYKGCLEPNTESIEPHQRIRTWRDGPKTSRKQEHFPRNAAGQDRNITWPPRSPDLTPLDFYLWGHIKSLFYVKNYENFTDLKKLHLCSLPGSDAGNRVSEHKEPGEKTEIGGREWRCSHRKIKCC